MYSGTTELSIDAKGRVAVPARYRASLTESCSGRLTVTLSLDSCLLVYPHFEWEVFAAKLMSLPSLTPQAKKLQRHFLGAAEDVLMDKQGRVQLTPYLRARAGLDKSAVFVGQGEKFELWDAQAWGRYQDEVELDAEFLASIGI
ncbi:MAG: division/cell wall cluster transcriptional repressor MraZ [Oceanococcus sp.]